jgi:uncharacterized membrane protein YeaQ/YmgE (transglycosylase-associated protein family)
MNLQPIMVAVVVGMVAGWLAGFVMKGGGYGLAGDVLLGICGSFVGGWLFHVLAIAPGAGWLPMIAMAFLGAVLIIVAQRFLFQVRA